MSTLPLSPLQSDVGVEGSQSLQSREMHDGGSDGPVAQATAIATRSRGRLGRNHIRRAGAAGRRSNQAVNEIERTR